MSDCKHTSLDPYGCYCEDCGQNCDEIIDHQQQTIDRLLAERRWIPVEERLPEVETPVLIVCNGETRIGELRWERPTYEETFKAFKYWDDPFDDGQCWEWHDVTLWKPLDTPPEAADE